MTNENEWTTPDGVRLIAEPTYLPKLYTNTTPSACFLCHFRDRAINSLNRCRPSGLPADEPRCSANRRADGRDIYWVKASEVIDPNPL